MFHLKLVTILLFCLLFLHTRKCIATFRVSHVIHLQITASCLFTQTPKDLPTSLSFSMEKTLLHISV